MLLFAEMQASRSVGGEVVMIVFAGVLLAVMTGMMFGGLIVLGRGSEVFGMIANSWRKATRHACPYCGQPLNRITVQDMDSPFPPGARWWCANSKCDARSFTDIAATKPAPEAEV